MDSTSKKIWRTVVFSGAMLGAPLVAADTKAPEKPQPTKPGIPADQIAAQKEIDAAKKRVEEATKLVAAAKVGRAEREYWELKLKEAKQAQADAEQKLADLKKPPTPLEKLQRELENVDKRVGAAIDEVVAAQNDTDRTTAKAKLEKLRKEKAEVEKRVAAEKARLEAAKRPRNLEPDRPVGRGFILS